MITRRALCRAGLAPCGRWAAPGLLAVAGWLLGVAGMAAEPQIDFVAAGLPANEALRLLSQVGGTPLATGPDLAGELGKPIRFVLVKASPIQVRQALGQVLNCWFMSEPTPATSVGAVQVAGTRFSRQDRLPIGRLETRVLTSELIRREAEPIRALLRPWLGEGCGIDYLASDGLWTATLDAAGHAQLVEVLTRFAKAEPAVPPLIPDLRPASHPTGPVLERTWADAVQSIATTWGISVALASSGDAPIGEPLPAMPLAELPAAIARRGAQAALIHGVLCLGHHTPTDRQHPAERRRFAVLPIRHLCGSGISPEHVLAAVKLRLGSRLAQPGWGIIDLDGSFLVVADPPAIHRCLDALRDIDRLGLADAARSWSVQGATPPPAP